MLGLVALASLLAALGTLHTLRNLRLLRRPPADPPLLDEQVSVLLPLRNEAARVRPCLQSLVAQTRLSAAEFLILDDGSTDSTVEVVQAEVGADPRFRLLRGGDAALPAGWLGKPWACQRLGEAATGSALVFVDADVTLGPTAIASTVALLRQSDLDLISPYPRQVASGLVQRLIQPLLQWSWLTTLPLDAAERSPRESLAAANGQLLCVDAAAYRRAGGHAAVRDQVIEDVALLRAVKRAHGRGGVAEGSAIATCHMYEDAGALFAGYTKSLWCAFGSPLGGLLVSAVLAFVYVLPAAAFLMAPTTRLGLVGLGGYAAAVAGRLLVALTCRQRRWPDALGHPLSIAGLCFLVAASIVKQRRGRLEWKGRTLPS